MAEQENGGNAEALTLNSKRQRRPSVRLGEIGDFPVAFTIDRPLKQRKKRRGAQQPVAALPEAPPMFEPLLGEDQLLMDVDMDADVDMTGFNLDDGGAGSPWDNSSRVPRTRPLEHVSNESPPAAATAPEEPEAEPEAEAEGADREPPPASKGKQKDEEQDGASFMDVGAGEAPVQAEEPARSVENAGDQQQQPEENGSLEQEQEQDQEAEGEQDAAPEKQQHGNGVVKKGRSRTPKVKYGRRKKSSSSRASAVSQRAKKSAAEAARRASRNTVDSEASEGECNGKEDDDKEPEDDGKDRKEELGNEKEEEDGGNNKQEATEKQSTAAAAAPPIHRVTRGSKSLPKDAECPSKSQQSSKVEKNLRSSRSRQPPPPPPPPTAKDSKGNVPDSSGDDEHQQQQIQQQIQQQTEEQREHDDDHHHQQQQKQQQRKQQHENGILGDNSSGDTGAVKEQAEQEHGSFVLPECVKKWLYERRLGKYVELFEFHEVDEDVLPLLTMEDLRDMGIIAIGARRKMFQAIQELG